MEVDKKLKKDELPSSDKCRCCLQEGELKELWSEYITDDGVMIYGQALVDCFSLTINQPSEDVEKICLTCIGKLQDAITFKKLVVDSDTRLLNQHFQGNKVFFTQPGDEVKRDDDENFSQDGEHSLSNDYNDSFGQELSDDIEISKMLSVTLSEDDNNFTPSLEYPEPSGSNKLKTTEGTKRRKKDFQPEDLKKCVEAVRSGLMTNAEAIKLFRVPYKVFYAKLRAEEKRENVSDPAREKIINMREKYKSFLKEIKVILKYTNAIPFKNRSSCYYCAYCMKNIDEADQLRTHTSTVHAKERLSGVDVFMKSNSFNEIIKLDIVDLRCIMCTVPIDGWRGMLQHLKEFHYIILEEAETKIIPYRLTKKLSCVLCSKEFGTYNNLNTHMNSHYSAYVCVECGDSFYSKVRLKEHSKRRHSSGKFQCPLCPKFFPSESYRKTHVDRVHNHSFKCRHCNEEFPNPYRRNRHMLLKHSEKNKTVSCEYCNKAFELRSNYVRHLRVMHGKQDVEKHKCSKCDKTFSMKHLLKKHEEWHLGHNRQTCSVCKKTFSSKQYLEKHYAKAHSDSEGKTSPKQKQKSS